MFQYGYKSAGGTRHVPAGWDWWIGLVGNSRYYNYTLSINGTGRHFSDQYLTNVIVSTVAIWKYDIYIFYQVLSYTPGLHVLVQTNCVSGLAGQIKQLILQPQFGLIMKSAET